MRMTFFIVDKLNHERRTRLCRPDSDLSLVALYEGKTRRARIVKMFLEQPEILLFDECL